MNYKTMRKRRGIYLAAILSMLVIICTGCKGASKDSDNLLMYLTFDEKGGTEITDSAGRLQKADVHYIYNNAAYMDNQEPGWRNTGVEGGSLLFDGCSTYVDYSADEICVSGDSFSASVWVAPRAFEWDDPNAAENGTEHLTAIISQYDKNKNQGVLLGYQRFGRLCFQVGTGEDWITLWGEDAKLEKYQWNLVTATFDGSKGEMNLYLNGDNIGSRAVPSGAASALRTEKSFWSAKIPMQSRLQRELTICSVV